jgi:hypothetical protein
MDMRITSAIWINIIPIHAVTISTKRLTVATGTSTGHGRVMAVTAPEIPIAIAAMVFSACRRTC